MKIKYPFLSFIATVSILITMIYWMFHKVQVDFELLNSQGVKTIGIISNIPGRSTKIAYVVDGQRWEYLKPLKGQTRSIVDRLKVGDTLEVTYLPEDPKLAYINLQSWLQFHNE
jgi:hypothetical protein